MVTIRSSQTPLERLAALGDMTSHEPAGDAPLNEGAIRPAPPQKNIPVEVAGVVSCITEVSTPRGKKPVLKAMVTTACEKDCYYCPFRAGRAQMKRTTFKPYELAEAFMQVHKAGLVEGLFLSSGIIKGGVTTQDKIIDVAEILRGKHQYRGYIHLKIMPGAEFDQLARAMQLADRVSVNLEGATPERLAMLAPKKDFDEELLHRVEWAADVRQAAKAVDPYAKTASIVTQFVVGAVGDTDLELLTTSDYLYQEMGLTRAYYARFKPVENTPLDAVEATPAIRERRLYEASFLLRDYSWEVEELPFEGEGNLRLDVDPKRAWADENLREEPVEINTAEKRDLLRIPGIGPKNAETILKARREGQLRDLEHLKQIGVAGVSRTAPYVLMDGKRPSFQLSLFEEVDDETAA